MKLQDIQRAFSQVVGGSASNLAAWLRNLSQGGSGSDSNIVKLNFELESETDTKFVLKAVLSNKTISELYGSLFVLVIPVIEGIFNNPSEALATYQEFTNSVLILQVSFGSWYFEPSLEQIGSDVVAFIVSDKL